MRYLKIIFLVAVVSLMTASGTGEMKFTEGIKPGSLAPEINLQDFSLRDDCYTLIQFWAAYDAESRIENVRMYNEFSQLNSKKLKMVSIAFDEKQSIFRGTIKADKLDSLTQFNDCLGKKSDIYKKFRLDKGFYNVLIDPQGVIIARNIQPNQKDLELIQTGLF